MGKYDSVHPHASSVRILPKTLSSLFIRVSCPSRCDASDLRLFGFSPENYCPNGQNESKSFWRTSRAPAGSFQTAVPHDRHSSPISYRATANRLGALNLPTQSPMATARFESRKSSPGCLLLSIPRAEHPPCIALLSTRKHFRVADGFIATRAGIAIRAD